jgi:thiol-disulfide isomerase/thioredoxin
MSTQNPVKPQNVRIVNTKEDPVNVNIITPPPQCDPKSHDFKNCDVSYVEDFDFSFNNAIFKPSLANPDNLYVIMVFADWCGHCKHFIPEYKSLATTLKDTRMKLCCIDGSREGIRPSERSLVSRIKEIMPEFRGFPTIVMYKGGKLIKTHQGERKAEALHSVLKTL